MTKVEKTIKNNPALATPRRPSNTVVHIGGTGLAPLANEKRKTQLRAKSSDFVVREDREDSFDVSDMTVEDGAHLLLDFLARVRAAHRNVIINEKRNELCGSAKTHQTSLHWQAN